MLFPLSGRDPGAGLGLRVVPACLARWVAEVVRAIDLKEPTIYKVEWSLTS